MTGYNKKLPLQKESSLPKPTNSNSDAKQINEVTNELADQIKETVFKGRWKKNQFIPNARKKLISYYNMVNGN